MLARRCRLCIRGSLYFLRWWVIPVGDHLSDCCTIAALSQSVMFYNRFVKWMGEGDGTNNDALCLLAVGYINVPLILVCVCVCVWVCVCVYVCESSPKGTDDPLLCSCTDAPIYEPASAVFHSQCQPNVRWSQVFSTAGWTYRNWLPKYYMWTISGSHGGAA